MKVLVINCGSSSLRFQLMDMEDERVMAKGKCDKIGLSGSFIEYKCPSKNIESQKSVAIKDHGEAMRILIEEITHPETGAIKDISEIGATGHRIVHGGENFTQSVIVDDYVIKEIEKCTDLSPLHNPGHIMGIKACQKILPGVPMVTVFDTAFHQTMPKEAYLYALPYKYYEKYKIRRYGFHGTSHRYVTERASDMLNIAKENLNIISCHLGNGASVCAIKNGNSIDTSMGLTPLEGLIMGTRTGDMDPAIAKYIIEHEKITVDEYNEIINKKSGLLGITEKTSDFREIKEDMGRGDERAKLAFEMQAYRIKKYIGSYMVALGHVDAITFEGGIGENNPTMTAAILDGLDELGIVLDPSKADYNCTETVISSDASKIKVLIIPTNEELMIARDTMKLISNN